MERLKKLFKYWKWMTVGAVALIVFTLIKLPDTKLKALVQGHLNVALASTGMSMSTTDSSVSMLFGIRYTARNVQWKWSPDAAPVLFDEVRISPSLLSLVLGKLSGSLRLIQGSSRITVSGGVNGNRFDLSLDLDDVDLEKLGALKSLAKIDVRGLAQGKVDLAGNLDAPTTLSGSAQIKISKINLPAQAIAGFQVPTSSISSVVLNLPIKNGKAECSECSVGSPASKPSDDLAGTLKGSIDLNRYLGASKAQLEARFRVSDKIKTAFVFLDSLLPPGSLQSDGSYGMSLSGTLEFLTMAPLRP